MRHQFKEDVLPLDTKAGQRIESVCASCNDKAETRDCEYQVSLYNEFN